MYNDRVAIITYVKDEDALGSPIKTPVETVVPCRRGRLTHEQQLGHFGKYDLSAFKLHLQGIYKDISEVKYKGEKRSVRGLYYHHNSTVVVV